MGRSRGSRTVLDAVDLGDDHGGQDRSHTGQEISSWLTGVDALDFVEEWRRLAGLSQFEGDSRHK